MIKAVLFLQSLRAFSLLVNRLVKQLSLADNLLLQTHTLHAGV